VREELTGLQLITPPKRPSVRQVKDGPPIHFFLEEVNEAAKWRWRTLFLVTVFGEVLFLLFLAVASGWIQRHELWLAQQEAANAPHQQTTFLVLPRDLQRELRAPRTNLLSNKNRLARGPSPVVKPNGLTMPFMRGNTHLPKVAGGSPPPPPKRMIPPSPAPKQETAQAQRPPQTKPQPPKPQPKPKIMLSDVTPPPQPNSELAQRLGMVTPGESIQRSLQAAAQGRSTGGLPGPGDSPDQLNNLNPNFSTSGPIILSDTRGVDFGPYLEEILQIVRQNWYAVIPESARLGEKGEVAIVFDIQKDGSVPKIELVSSSGKRPLDLAAIASIRASIPFPPLPSQFTGNHLLLQFNYFYNETP
jgi:TonB family protein